MAAWCNGSSGCKTGCGWRATKKCSTRCARRPAGSARRSRSLPTLGQFAATLGISQPNATYKVNNLVAKGYLEKIPGEDRREVRLQTAGKFNAYYHDNEQALREAMDALAGRFSPEELDAAERVMQALVQTVETEKGD